MKNRLISLILTGASVLVLASCGSSSEDNGGGTPDSPTTPDTPEALAPQPVAKTNAMNVYVHYMPWFVAPEKSGVWNHWTMSTNGLASDGANYGSWYHPQTGAYASDDADILDYQCLLMKYSGIDGVIADWYGTQQSGDAPMIESCTEALFKAVKKAGLKLAICYEDQATKSASNAVTQARLDMRHLEYNYFKSDSYAKADGKPLLLCFGPQNISTPADWSRVFSILSTRPTFAVLPDNSSKCNDSEQTNAQGEFTWVNPTPDYSTASNYGIYIGGAMPGFHDHYKASGQGNGYTTYDDEGGALFQRQLAAAQGAGLKWLQISTWNDYGEGTIIEPTTEFGYRYLTQLQTFTGVSYKQSVLESIYQWYQLRKKLASNASAQKKLDQAYIYFAALQPDKALAILKAL